MQNGVTSSPRQRKGYGLVFEVRSAAIWTQMRLGVQAALCTSPEDIENCKPRTELGRIVRGLVIEAGKGRSTALKTLLRFLEDVEDEEIDAVQRMLPDIEWDWSMDGVWLTRAEGPAEIRESASQSPRPITEDEAPLSRQQRRYLARLHEKGETRAAQVPRAA